MCLRVSIEVVTLGTVFEFYPKKEIPSAHDTALTERKALHGSGRYGRVQK
ncbi:MAG: hypothetical protein Q4A26_02210 [Candidatus Saccharibacteria bacterium]|nr:hypothetical protein [Candidatus Saccharibacteria bacterium]